MLVNRMTLLKENNQLSNVSEAFEHGKSKAGFVSYLEQNRSNE